MTMRRETGLAPIRRDPLGMLRQMTAELDRMFDEPFLTSFRWPFRTGAGRGTSWAPEIDVFEKGNRLITRIDLPGMKKDDVKVEVTDGHLAISGERKSETEEEKENYYRCEREFGSFYRAVPLPPGVTIDKIEATFADGVLEVTVPLPAKPEANVRKVEIQETKPKAA